MEAKVSDECLNSSSSNVFDRRSKLCGVVWNESRNVNLPTDIDNFQNSEFNDFTIRCLLNYA